MYHNCYVNENSHSGPIPSNSNLSNFSNSSSCQRVSWGILGETLRSVGRLSERFVVVFMWWWWRWPSWSLEIGVAQYFLFLLTKSCTLCCLTKLIGQSTIYFPSLCVFQDQAMCCCSIHAVFTCRNLSFLNDHCDLMQGIP